MKLKIIIFFLLILSFLFGMFSGVLLSSQKNKITLSETNERNIEVSNIVNTDTITSSIENTTEYKVNIDFEDETDYTAEISKLLSDGNYQINNNTNVFFAASSIQNCLTLYIKQGFAFRKVCSCYAWFGINGVSDNKTEGDLCTPCGLFDLGTAFGLDDNPGTDYPYKKATEKSFWIDDPDSCFYNQWVELTDDTEKDWKSAERLSDYPDRYNCGFIIEYNTINTVPGKGSAIFLHCGDRKTLGCIAISHEDMLKIMSTMSKNDKAQIYIF